MPNAWLTPALFYATGPPGLPVASITTPAPLLTDTPQPPFVPGTAAFNGFLRDGTTGYTVHPNANNSDTDDLYILADFGTPLAPAYMEFSYTNLPGDLGSFYQSGWRFSVNRSDGVGVGAPVAFAFADFGTDTHPVITTEGSLGPDTAASRYYLLHIVYTGTGGNADKGTVSTVPILPVIVTDFRAWGSFPTGTGPVPGCTNPAALNYNPLATVDDGSCVFPVVTVGCTDPRATNYNPTATVDNGSCVLPALPVRGCTDPAAINYNGLAAQSDGSCQYAVPVPTQAPPFVAACPCLWTATLLPIKAWAIVVPPVGTWIQKPC